jgi:crossover junction endodeoxyribonuclease RuvC
VIPEVVLGIDPGLSRCGYGAVRREGQNLVALACGVLRTDMSASLPERLAQLQGELDELLADLRPDAMAVERILFQVNARTAITVGQASGLALAAAASRRVPVAHYSPNEVKLAVTGYGGADKAQVQAMVARLLELSEPPHPADAADALALALCHLWVARLGGASATPAAPANARLQAAVAAAIEREKREAVR